MLTMSVCKDAISRIKRARRCRSHHSQLPNLVMQSASCHSVCWKQSRPVPSSSCRRQHSYVTALARPETLEAGASRGAADAASAFDAHDRCTRSTHSPVPVPATPSSGQLLRVMGLSGAACIGVMPLLLPLSAAASGGTLTGSSLEVFKQFLVTVEGMGPWGMALFVVLVMLFEMVPLFPTQPLSLASGLLFGGTKGAVLMLLGVTLAATNAFLLARGLGRPLAQRIIDAELAHADQQEGAEGRQGKQGGRITQALAKVEAAIEAGGLGKQVTAVALLRLTPVVPFSASNYLLGLTPLRLPAFLAGTLVGMSVWSAVYAGLGGASRGLLEGGQDIEELLAGEGHTGCSAPTASPAAPSCCQTLTRTVCAAGMLRCNDLETLY
ncbi:snare associated Golgi protein-domain-containing protein [Haematococcus lacustris]